MSPKRIGRATLDDVAARAGVSRATISRVLNGGVRSASTISDELRETILAAARDLDYSPNSQAQAMAAGPSRTVAILVTEIDDLGSSAMVAGATRQARALGYSAVVALAGLSAAEEINAVRALRSQRPTALVVAVSRTSDVRRETAFEEELSAYATAGGRVSVIGRNSFGFDEVILRNERWAEALADSLVDRGYRRFAVVTGNPEMNTAYDRAWGFAAGLRKRGVPFGDDAMVFENFDRDGGYRAASQLLARMDEFDVIFATSDAMALGVLTRLREERILVPGQIAVAGFDDVPMVRDLTPALTTVHVPLEALSAAAVAQALEPSDGVQHLEIDGRVILRESTPELD